jgi:eukaryotic-like serine/threonine-protein kinase
MSHYRLLDPLASGGMGVVYRAEDTELGRTVALKILPPQIVHDPRRKERLREEARTASALNHPNICTIYEVGEEQGELFIAMEYVEGRPLSEYIRESGMTVSRVLRYGKQIAAALDHAHGRGIIHRDLKPLNIIVTPEGDTKILDFGLAKRCDPGEVTGKTFEAGPTDTSPGLAGTLPYMSPEQLEGQEATVRSDIWSLGVVLYEMASGLRPFGGENLYRLCTAIVQDPLPLLPENVPPGLAAVIRRCLEKEPARRYQHASEVRAALEALEPSSAVSIAPPTPAPRAWKLAVLAISIVAVAGLAAGGFWLVKKSKSGPGRQPAEPPAQQVQLAVLLPEASAQPAEAAFDSGLAETLTSNLTELTVRHPLAVIPASEMRSRHVTTLDAARQEFGVNYGLVLVIQRAAGQMRVNYSLVDARSHQQLRGGTITAAAADPFALQDRVSSQVVETLKLELAPQERKALAAHGTTEPAAYDFYLQGRGYLQDYERAENIENAITVFRRALEKDPSFPAAFAGLGEAYWRKFNSTHDNRFISEAANACQNATDKDSGLAEGHVCLGLVNQATGKYEQAVAEYQKAAEREPTLDAAPAGLARAYESLNRLSEAEQAYKAAVALRPNYWAGYNRLGAFYLKHGKMEEAAQAFSQMVSLAPDSFVGYSNLGATRVQQSRYAEAIPPLERSLEIRKTAGATSNLGTAYFSLHRYADAVKAYEDAVRMDEKEYVLWGNLGDAYFWAPGRRQDSAGAYRKAIRLTEQALRVNGRDADALSSISLYHAMLGERAPAVEYLKRALTIEPKRPDLLLNAAIAYVQLGDQNRSLDYLESAVAVGLPPKLLRDLPNFDGLRGKPRFQNLFSQHGTRRIL